MEMSTTEMQNGIIPFWFWNGRMEEAELSRQLNLAKAAGVRGMTVHARMGNRIPYLSERWMELMLHTCRKAEELGLEIWLYDEEGFPSGTAGGALPLKGEAFQQKHLVFSEMSSKEAANAKNVIRVFRKDKPEIIVSREELPRFESVLVFQRHITPDAPDFLNPEMVYEFLAMTHERYAAVLGRFFGTAVTGVFTDDSHFLLGPGPLLAYADDLEESFASKYGYSLLDHLSFLVENVHGAAKVRLDYYQHLAECFNERFTVPMRDWCRRHGLRLYGHLSGDEGPFPLMIRNFADPAAYYMALDVPGIDDHLASHLGNRYMKDALSPFPAGGELNRASGFSLSSICKQASSVASQMSDGKCMAETFASLGWGIPLENLIAQLNFLYILGINIIVPHDYAYSTGLCGKRDHPASFFFQQPYFRFSKELFAQTDHSLEMVSRGRVAADTLVIYPLSSAQISSDGEEIDEPGAFLCSEKGSFPRSSYYTKMLAELNLYLLRNHISFEYGFESVIAVDAKVEGARFCAGKASYSNVILPELVNISARLKDLLLRFAANGGKIIYLGRTPCLVDGENFAQEKLPPGEKIAAVSNLAGAGLEPDLKFHTAGLDAANEIALGARIVDGKKEYMLVNYNADACVLKLFLEGYECYDPVSDALFGLPGELRMECFRALHLAPCGSLEKQRVPVERTSFFSYKEIIPEKCLKSWRVSRDMPNVFLIDSAKAPCSREIQFDDYEYNFQPQGMSFHTEFLLSFPLAGCGLCFEPAAISALKLNGKNILERKGESHAASNDLRVVEIGDILRQGTNIISFQLREKRPEYFYLLGDFCVEIENEKPVLRQEKPLCFGELAAQGLPFYWGSIHYALEFESEELREEGRWLDLGCAHGGVAAVEINGSRLPALPCGPQRFCLDSFLGKVINKIEVTLCNTAQNFFGPHRVEVQRKHLTGWRPKSRGVFALAPFGLESEPRIVSFRK